VPGQTANVGLLDEEAAVRWVVDNIEHFGGDPANITMMGQSAGGFNIAAMLAREPLFNRAILQSASLGRGFREPAQAAHLSNVFLQATGAQTLEQARALPVASLLAAQQAPSVMAALKEEGANRSLFCPVGDAEFFSLPLGPLMQQAATRADVLLGYTRDEMTAFPGTARDLASQQLGEKIFGAPSRQWAHDAHAAQPGDDGKAPESQEVRCPPDRRCCCGFLQRLRNRERQSCGGRDLGAELRRPTRRLR
jgi:para-nitrobenzyl esterase